MRSGLGIAALLISLTSLGQSGYQIDVKIKGLKDTTVYLAYYYGESKYVKDTAQVDHTGSFRFDGAKSLAQGIYFLVVDKTPIIEIAMGEDQHFKLETSTEEYVKDMKVTGDEDNRLFFEDRLFEMQQHQKAEPYLKVLQDSTATADQKKEASTAFSAIRDEVLAHQQKVIDDYPNTMTARLFKANQPIQIPDAPVNADGSIDSSFQFKYYRAHFFDNFDLADDALIRLPQPLYQKKVLEYLDKLFVPDPDTIMNAINQLVKKAKSNQETYKYLVWSCMSNYSTTKIMGLDEVYVRLYDQYVASGEMDFWINASLKKSIKEYVDKVRLSLLGMTAPNLIMQDLNLQPKSMYDIKKKYTMVYVFDPDCGHCREETPKLVKFYNEAKDKYDFEVYAVSADTSMKKMKDYIKEMKMTWITVNGPRSYVGSYQKLYDAFSTPSLFVLDDKKQIIAKKLSIEQLREFMERYDQMMKRKEKAVKGT